MLKNQVLRLIKYICIKFIFIIISVDKHVICKKRKISFFKFIFGFNVDIYVSSSIDFIEKNVWAGLEDFYKCLGRSLEDESVRRQGLVGGVEVLRVPKRESTKVSSSIAPATHVPVPRISLCTAPAPPSCNERTVWCVLGALTVLLLLNAFLYYKLFAMENLNTEPQLESILDARMFG